MAHIRCDFRSEVMDMGTSMTVFLPEAKDCASVRVVYLLHGLADNCTGWARYTSVERYARRYDVAVVIPEVQRSFYSDMRFGIPYYSFIHDELPKLCRNMFGFSAKRENNYVMGLSMGGYGALKCVLNTPRRYAGCAAFSAVTDFEHEVNNTTEQRTAEYKAMFGQSLKIPADSNLHRLLDKRSAEELPPFYIACGKQDRLCEQDEAFSGMLKAKGVSVLFEKWDGIHNWDFWDVAVEKAFRYFFEEKAR